MKKYCEIRQRLRCLRLAAPAHCALPKFLKSENHNSGMAAGSSKASRWRDQRTDLHCICIFISIKNVRIEDYAYLHSHNFSDFNSSGLILKVNEPYLFKIVHCWITVSIVDERK